VEALARCASKALGGYIMEVENAANERALATALGS